MWAAATAYGVAPAERERRAGSSTPAPGYLSMQQRRVGSTGLTVSRLGLGTMTWGRDTDEHEARDQLIAFAETGAPPDTVYGYGNGARRS